MKTIKNPNGDNHDHLILYPSASEDRPGGVALKEFTRSVRLAEIRAVYRSRRKLAERRSIRSPQDVEAYLRAIWNQDTLELVEDFVVICLNGNHQAIGWVKVASGGFQATTVDPRLIFAVALQTASSAVIVAHNHPSGDTTPSQEDRRITERLHEAGTLLGIKLLDHLIVTRETAFSFREHGLI